jgi:hypothetical protein
VLLIVTLVCAERAVHDCVSGARITAAVGVIGGVLFFEHLLYFPLVIYPTLLIAAAMPVQLILGRALLAAGCGIVSALVLLSLPSTLGISRASMQPSRRISSAWRPAILSINRDTMRIS